MFYFRILQCKVYFLQTGAFAHRCFAHESFYTQKIYTQTIYTQTLFFVQQTALHT